jgi:hypothetical protein
MATQHNDVAGTAILSSRAKCKFLSDFLDKWEQNQNDDKCTFHLPPILLVFAKIYSVADDKMHQLY